jgi:hypothetical protein
VQMACGMPKRSKASRKWRKWCRGGESSGDVEPGVVVESVQESLIFGLWPALVDGTLALEAFTEGGATKGNDRGGPGTAMVAAAGFDLKSLAVLEPASSKLVEAGFSYMETMAGFGDSNPTGIEFMKGLKNNLACESAGKLAFFIALIDRIQLILGTPDFRSLFGGVSPPPKSGSMDISCKMWFSIFEPAETFFVA